MHTSSEPTRKTSSTVIRQTGIPFFARKHDMTFFQGNHQAFSSASFIQPKLTVSQPEDPQEKEADQMADRVMTMPDTQVSSAPAEKEEEIQRQEEEEVQRTAAEEIRKPEDGKKDKHVSRKIIPGNGRILVARSGRSPPGPAKSSFEHSLSSARGTGSPLPGDTRSFMESRFNADFSGVRIHTGELSVQMNREINSQAFTYGNDIFFNSGKYSTGTPEGQSLIAHELTHTIQQGASSHISPENTGKQKNITVAAPKVQRGIFSTIRGAINSAVGWVGDRLEEGKKWLLGKIRNLIMKVPGYKALRVVLGEDPITGEHVDRNGKNFIDAALDIMPFGQQLKEKMQELGILEKAEQFVDKTIGRFKNLVNGIFDVFSNFWNSLSLSDIRDISGVFSRLENAFTSFFEQIKSFASGVAGDFLGFIKKALLIPLGNYIKTRTRFWDLLCLIMGKDPLTDEPRPLTGANVLNAFLNLSEWGIEQRKKMQETGTFNKIAAWIDKGIAVFSKSYYELKAAFRSLWDYVNIQSLMHPVETFRKIFDSFRRPVERVGSFVIGTGITILKIVKEVLFKRISNEAKGRKGFYLITVLIGKDPFTDEKVDRSTENIIKGFMLLTEGGEEQFNKMKESGAIDKATQKIDAAVKTLGFSWNYVKGLFINLWNSFTWKDLLVPLLAFAKIINTFKDPVLRLIRFVITVMTALFEIILRLMGFPVDLVIKLIDNVVKAWNSIRANPSGFFMNVLRAIKQGFIQFFDKILTHLWNGLKAWLRQELTDAGLPIPADFSVTGIIKWLLVVLDITMEKIWKKLEARIGKEKVDKIRSLIDKAEALYDKANEALVFIEDVRQRGMEAVVDRIKEKLSNIWDLVLGAVRGFIMDQIIRKVTAKLLSMLDPTGIMAVVNSAKALYKAIQSFIKYLARLLEIVNSFVEGIIEICAGNIAVAANFLERSLANGIPVVIGFLANQVGLDLSGRIKDVLATVREKVDKGLDFLIDKLVGFVEKLVEKAKSAKDKIMGWLGMKKTFTSSAGKNHSLYFREIGSKAKLIIETEPMYVGTFLMKRKGEIPSDKTLDAAKKADHLAKVAQAEKLNSEIEALTYPKDKQAPQDDKNELEILSKSEALIELLKELDPIGAAAVIPAPTFLPGFNGNKAQFMEVKYLSGYSDPNDPALPKPNYQKGEDASNYKGTLNGALTTLEGLGVRSKWVAFHIVNDNYGGKATDSNLVPAPQEINKNYLNEFEVKLKAYLKNKETVWMKFYCKYKNTTPFLESINATGGAMKFENNQWVEDPAKTEPFSKNVDFPLATVVHVNSLKKDAVLWYFYTRETPLDTKTLDFLADEVEKGVKFHSVSEIQNAVLEYFKPATNRLFNDVGKTKFSF